MESALTVLIYLLVAAVGIWIAGVVITIVLSGILLVIGARDVRKGRNRVVVRAGRR